MDLNNVPSTSNGITYNLEFVAVSEENSNKNVANVVENNEPFGNVESNECAEDPGTSEEIRNIAREVIDRHLSANIINQYDSLLRRAILVINSFPKKALVNKNNHKFVTGTLPDPSENRCLDFGAGFRFNIKKLIGKGSYGTSFKALDADSGDQLTLKYITPCDLWEAYIYHQIKARISNSLTWHIDVTELRFTTVVGENALLLGTNYSKFGTLLDVCRLVRSTTGKPMHELLVMHFAIEICVIVEALHSMKIIHCDIKLDNFVLMRIPSANGWYSPSLRIIDFGNAIDMTVFDQRKFSVLIETDIFCVAGTVHCLLFNKYMEIEKNGDRWAISRRLPRYFMKSVWENFFDQLINIDVENMDNILQVARNGFLSVTLRMKDVIKTQIRKLSNILNNL